MARKGYSSSNKEKIIYDNTVFRGVSATTDPNPEGYFKQLINFDISDTGQSLQPRKGFMNTVFHIKNGDNYEYVNLNYDSTIYYLDHETGNYYFIDFSKISTSISNNTISDTFIYKTDLTNIDKTSKYFLLTPINNYITKAEDVETIVYLQDYLGSNFISTVLSTIKPVKSHKATYIKDSMSVDRNIIKVSRNLYTNGALTNDTEEFWLEFKYNATTSTMLITVVNTNDVKALDMTNRNIASSASLVPNPIAIVYDNPEDATADGKTYSQFPMIYKSKGTGSNKKYLLNYTDSLDGLKIEPSYYLYPHDDGYKWVYTYDILSTSNITKQFSSYTEEELKQSGLSKYTIYQAPVFNLDGNTNIFQDYLTLDLFNEKYDLSTLSSNYLISNNLDSNHTGVISDSQDNGIIYINSSSFLSGSNYIGSAILSDNKNTGSLITTTSVLDDYIIYIVPKNNTAPSTYDLTNRAYSYSVEFNNISDLFGSTIDPMKLLNKLFTPCEDDMYYNKYEEQEYCIPIISSMAEEESDRLYNIYSDTLDRDSSVNILNFINFAEKYKNDFEYYVEKVNNVMQKNITDEGATLYNCGRTALNSGLLIWDTEPISYDELYENYLKQYVIDDIDFYDRPVTITVKPMFTRCRLNIYNNVLTMLHIWYNNRSSISTTTNTSMDQVVRNIELYFPNLFKFASENELIFKDTIGSLIIPNNNNNSYTINNTSEVVAKTYYVYTSCTSRSMYLYADNKYIDYTRSEDSEFILNMLCGFGEYINKSGTSDLTVTTVPDISTTLGSSNSNTLTIDISSYSFTTSYLYNKPTFNTNNCGRSVSRPMPGNISHNININPENSITYNRYKTLFSYNNGIDSIFSNTDGIISLSYNLDNYILYRLSKYSFFTNGMSIVVYFSQIPTVSTITTAGLSLDPSREYSRSYIVASTILQNNTSVQLKYNSDNDKTNIIDEALDGADEDPAIINECTEWCIFNSLEGYRLVVWARNNVYMSEAGDYNYFKEANKKVYPEPVVKVLSFKDMLLVFTTQNMYSIFPYEITEQVQDGTDDEGNPKYVQQKRVIYNTLPVLYNLYTDKRYKDVIQVYNGMILFYSADGQLYLISPSTQIDTDTQFSLKYINKSVNDILLNYDKYINERLSVYYNTHDFEFVSKEKDGDILITASVSISNIKIYYSVPKYTYTYILIYDITNNRYTVYDTATFGKAQSVLQTNMYDLVITKSPSNTLSAVIPYTEPNVVNNNCDLTTVDNYTFIQHDIMTELDTGIIYLNNQWKKRFRTLQTTYKNIDANDLLFNLDVIVDDIFISSTMGDTLVLKNIDANNREALYYVSDDRDERADLVRNPNIKEEDLVKNIPVNRLTPSEFLKNNQKLFDFSSYSSNKIITHYTNIPSLGKHIELRLRFNSKGKYKLQGFTLVYKEHSV